MRQAHTIKKICENCNRFYTGDNHKVLWHNFDKFSIAGCLCLKNVSLSVRRNFRVPNAIRHSIIYICCITTCTWRIYHSRMTFLIFHIYQNPFKSPRNPWISLMTLFLLMPMRNTRMCTVKNGRTYVQRSERVRFRTFTGYGWEAPILMIFSKISAGFSLRFEHKILCTTAIICSWFNIALNHIFPTSKPAAS